MVVTVHPFPLQTDMYYVKGWKAWTVRQVSCPTCAAEPGFICLTKRGSPLYSEHGTRVQRFEELAFP